MSNFAARLKELRDHQVEVIQTGRKKRFTPSAEFTATVANDNRRTLSAEEEEVVAGLELLGQSLGKEEAAENEAAITKATQELKDKGNTPEAQKTFKEQMEAAREKSKDRALKNVDKVYDEAIKVGEAFPESQSAILSAVEKIDNFFTELFGKIVDFVVKIVDEIVVWVNKAWNEIKSTFNKIGNWISSWF